MKAKAKRRKTVKAAKAKRTSKKIKKTGKKRLVQKTRGSIFSKRAVKRFKQLLLKQREKLVGQVEHIANDTLKQSQREASGDLSGYTLHMADVATDHYDREFSLGIATTEQRLIYEIDEALKRIEDGSFGVCFTCDRPIGSKRLAIVPYAKFCINCQQKEESLQARIP